MVIFGGVGLRFLDFLSFLSPAFFLLLLDASIIFRLISDFFSSSSISLHFDFFFSIAFFFLLDTISFLAFDVSFFLSFIFSCRLFFAAFQPPITFDARLSGFIFSMLRYCASMITFAFIFSRISDYFRFLLSISLHADYFDYEILLIIFVADFFDFDCVLRFHFFEHFISSLLFVFSMMCWYFSMAIFFRCIVARGRGLRQLFDAISFFIYRIDISRNIWCRWMYFSSFLSSMCSLHFFCSRFLITFISLIIYDYHEFLQLFCILIKPASRFDYRVFQPRVFFGRRIDTSITLSGKFRFQRFIFFFSFLSRFLLFVGSLWYFSFDFLWFLSILMPMFFRWGGLLSISASITFSDFSDVAASGLLDRLWCCWCWFFSSLDILIGSLHVVVASLFLCWKP